jgi:probable rRNA maturation factor
MRDPRNSRSAEAREPPERLHLEVVYHDGDWRQFEPIVPALNAAGRALVEVLSVPAAVAAVALSSDEHVRKLNRAYRGEDKPTNVLSFPAPGASGGADGTLPFLGDIVLAAETVARETVEQGRSPRDHLQHLVLHGLLHLHGYDHRCVTEADEMEALEVKILGRLGIPNPYAEPVGPPAQ